MNGTIEMQTKRIPLERLLFKPNAPAGMNPYVLMSLAYMLRSGVTDPEPIVVRKIGRNRHLILDGRHGVVASMIAGRKDVLAIIEKTR